MATLKFTLTEDMLRLISNITYKKVQNIDEEQKTFVYGIDFYNLYGGTEITFENIAYTLGIYDKHIEGTEEDPFGAKFPKEIEDYIWDLHSNIVEHIEWIEELVHQFCFRGGLTVGTYKCNSYDHIWEKV